MVLPILIPAALALAREFLPDLVTAIAGDASGKVASAVLDQVEDITGTRDAGKAAAILRADPDKLVALRGQAIAAVQAIEQAYLADRQDARRMAVERLKGGGSDTRPNVMLVMAGLTLIVIVVVLAKWGFDLPDMVIGILASIAGGIVQMLNAAFQFEFGSSRGSKSKDELLALTRGD